jgi:hypothetical protein
LKLELVPEISGFAPINSQVVPGKSRVDAVEVSAVPENYRVVWENPETDPLNREVGREEFQVSPAESRADPRPRRGVAYEFPVFPANVEEFLTVTRSFRQVDSSYVRITTSLGKLLSESGEIRR